ncbi:hypothetical protein ACS0TY_019798 [Phlomoides rotata]
MGKRINEVGVEDLVGAGVTVEEAKNLERELKQILVLGYLGAIDETYIDVHVPTTDKGWYMNRKDQVIIIFVINEYPNCEGFLTPYKDIEYHLSGHLDVHKHIKNIST